MPRLHLAAALIVGVAFAVPAAAQTAALTFDMAERAAEVAEEEARENGWNVTIVVADTAGIPVYLKRLDGASPRSYDIAMRKAFTSAATGLSTAEYGRRVEAGQVAEVENGITFAGGVPILVDGRVIGAIGTSGVRAEQDEQISAAGVDAIVD